MVQKPAKGSFREKRITIEDELLLFHPFPAQTTSLLLHIHIISRDTQKRDAISNPLLKPAIQPSPPQPKLLSLSSITTMTLSALNLLFSLFLSYLLPPLTKLTALKSSSNQDRLSYPLSNFPAVPLSHQALSTLLSNKSVPPHSRKTSL